MKTLHGQASVGQGVWSHLSLDVLVPSVGRRWGGETKVSSSGCGRGGCNISGFECKDAPGYKNEREPCPVRYPLVRW
jgi:hypothetical protein